MTNVVSTNNAVRVEQLRKAWSEILAETLRRGFHGTAQIEVTIHDGSIQQFRRKIEQIEK
jgi:hypothetical protein